MRRIGLMFSVLVVLLSTSQMVICKPEKVDTSIEEHFKEGGRDSIKLTGRWEMLPASRVVFPPEGKWEEVVMQEPWFVHIHWRNIKSAWGDYPCMWYKKKISISDEWSGKRIKIKFWAVAHNSYIYFNEKKVGENQEGFSPFEIDVTGAAKFGEKNQLLVGVEGGTGSLIKNPITSWYSGICQKAELIAYPKVYVKDVFVKPSVRKKSLEIEITLSNEDDRLRTLILSNIVENGINFPLKKLALKPKEEKIIKIEKEWKNPVYWSLDNPHLYALKTEIGYEGEIIDEIRTGFGFREFWSEGPNLYLNGIKVRLRNKWLYRSGLEEIANSFGKGLAYESFVSAWKDIKKTGYNSSRTHATPFPPLAYETADEAGILIIAETALFGGTPSANSTPEEISACLEHTRRFVLTNRNHPSIVLWSGGNEQGYGAPVTNEFFNQQMDLILSVDPTRLIQHSGMGMWFSEFAGEDLTDKQMLYNFHYIENPLGWPYWGIFPDIPNHFYWPIDENVWPGVGGWSHGKRFVWKKGKPVLMGEHLGGSGGEWTAVVGGDAVYREKPRVSWERWDDPDSAEIGAWTELYRMVSEAYRYCNVAMFSPLLYPAPSSKILSEGPFAKRYAREILADLGTFIKEYDRHFYEREKVNRTVVVYNESLKEKDLAVAWKLDLDGEVLSSKKKKIKVKPGEVRTEPLLFTAPQVKKREKITFSLSLLDKEETIYSKTYIYDIFPRRNMEISQEGRIALFDPEGKTKEILRKEKIQFETIRDLNEIEKMKPELLILGYHSLNEIVKVKDLNGIASVIESFVREGGNVLVLEQQNLSRIFPVTLKLSREEEVAKTTYWVKVEDFGLSTICFLRAKGHPVLKGLEEDDLKFWREDNLVTRDNLNKPERGNFLILADSGFGHNGLSRTPLIEMPYGKGTYLVSQLEVTSKYTKEPVASLLLENMVNYGLSASYKENKTGIFMPEDSLLLNMLIYDMGVIGDEAEIGKLDNYDILIIYGELLKELDISKIREFVNSGGKVLLHNITPVVKDKIEELLERKISLRQQKLGPTIFMEDPLTLGLASYNLYWLTKFISADAGQTISDKGLRYILRIENSHSLSNPEGLIKVNLGKGFIILNQFLWDEVSANNRLKALNYASILFTNLGIPLEKGRALSLRLPHEGSKVPVVRKPISGPHDVDSSGFIREWLLCGPFPNRGERQDWEKGWEGKVGFEGWQKDYLVSDGGELMIEPEEGMGYKVPFPSFPPHWKEGTADINWHRHTSAESRIDLGILTYRDLELTVPDYTVAYAACYVHSPEDRYVFMAFGSDDAYKVWLNHELIGESPVQRASAIDQDFFPVVLKKGYNLVLIKVDNSLWDWVLYLRFLDREKIPLTDITVWF